MTTNPDVDGPPQRCRHPLLVVLAVAFVILPLTAAVISGSLLAVQHVVDADGRSSLVKFTDRTTHRYGDLRPGGASDVRQPGFAVTDHGFSFSATRVRTGLASLGQGKSLITPNGQFILVDVTITNQGGQPARPVESDQQLGAGQNRYRVVPGVNRRYTGRIWTTFAAHESRSGVMVFDLPTTERPDQLLVRGPGVPVIGQSIPIRPF